MSATTNGIKCDSCGRFMKWDDEGNSGLFVPDSHFTFEEVVDWCADCTRKHGGPPRSRQRVRHEMVSGYWRADR